MADSKVLQWYEELQPVELHVESSVVNNIDDKTKAEMDEDDDDAEYWAAFDDATAVPADTP